MYIAAQPYSLESFLIRWLRVNSESGFEASSASELFHLRVDRGRENLERIEFGLFGRLCRWRVCESNVGLVRKVDCTWVCSDRGLNCLRSIGCLKASNCRNDMREPPLSISIGLSSPLTTTCLATESSGSELRGEDDNTRTEDVRRRRSSLIQKWCMQASGRT